MPNNSNNYKGFEKMSNNPAFEDSAQNNNEPIDDASAIARARELAEQKHQYTKANNSLKFYLPRILFFIFLFFAAVYIFILYPLSQSNHRWATWASHVIQAGKSLSISFWSIAFAFIANKMVEAFLINKEK